MSGGVCGGLPVSVAGIGDVYASRRVHRHADRAVESRAGGEEAVAGVTLSPRPGDGADHVRRRVHLAGVTVSPDEIWMKQIARNMTAAEQGFLNGKQYILLDRDTKFSEAFRDILEDAGVEPVRLPPRSPNCNAHLERFFRGLKEECLNRMIFFGEHSLRLAVTQFLEHYHGERNHQGLDNRLIEPDAELARTSCEVECRERLGGLLRFYHRKAAA